MADATPGQFPWSKAAALTFGAWAVMLPIGVAMVSRAVDKVVEEQRLFNNRFETYVLNMERRVTIIEERQNEVRQRLGDVETKFQAHKDNGKK